MPTSVNCPTCEKLVVWSAEESPYRPFCSKRCKLIDLGEWFAENHRISGDPAEDPDGPPGTGEAGEADQRREVN